MGETTGATATGPSAALRTAMMVGVAMHNGLYRLSKGRIGGRVRGAPVLLLTTTGRKTGQARTRPVAYLADGQEIIVTASAGGLPRHPAWYHNVRANPRVTVQVGDRDRTMVARVTEGEERDRLWARVVQAYPVFAGYERKTTRRIPVVVLRPESAPTG